MVLVDTSVWIRFLRGRSPYAVELDRLLESSEAAGHDLVYGELLIGDSGAHRQLLNSCRLIHQVPSVAHASHKLHGRGIGWIDMHLLASALVAGLPLWTADEPLARLAGELGVAYGFGRT